MSLKRKKRVLAIDDEPSMNEWLKILLEHAGYDVRTALIGTRGEELFRTWRPDVVVTDMMLPDIDGIELVRKFKALEPEAEVIVITGQGNIPRSVEAVKAGAFDFLEKPIDAERLLDKLEKAMKRKSLVDENELLKQKLQDRYKFQNVIGKGKTSSSSSRARRRARRTSSSRVRTARARNSSPMPSTTTASA